MELGSEFDLDLSRLTDTHDTIFTYLKDFRAIYTDSGRSALRMLSGLLQGKAILMPDYVCETIAEALPEDCHIIYYPVNYLFQINVEKLEELLQVYSIQFLYVMHYFGALQQESCIAHIARLKQKYHLTVIEDTTHSLFTARKTIGDYIVASLRKWFPIPDGGVLYADRSCSLPEYPKSKKPASQKVEAMLLKKLYLTENFDCNVKYREIFAKEEDAFRDQTCAYRMSDMSRFLLSHFSIESMCHSRQRNVAQLLEGLHKMQCVLGHNIRHISEADKNNIYCIAEGFQHGYGVAISPQPTDIPLALPIYTAKRDFLRKLLMEDKIYCAVHWPLGHPAAYAESRWMEAHILSLPIDQRYQKEEMQYLLDCLEACKKKMQ